MQELRVVAVSAEGHAVVLAAPGGERFSVRIDDQLRAAVRLDRAHLGQLQIQREGSVRPREIQARIRAGETVEAIASAAGVDVEHVRRFEGPIRAERDYVAAQARAVVPRRGQGRHASLAELVAERLHARLSEHVAADDQLEWDAWRRDDGTWSVHLTFPSGTSTASATWRFDTGRRSVVPEDDNALWLTEGEQVSQLARALTAVRPGEAPTDPRELVYDVEADGGLDRIGEPLRLRRAPGDHLATVISVSDAREDQARSTTSEATEETQPTEAAESAAEAAEPATETTSAPGARRRAGRRASVPSWDDILLGTRRQP